MKNKLMWIIFAALCLAGVPVIANYYEVSILESVMAVVGLPLILVMSVNIWRLADAIDRLSENK